MFIIGVAKHHVITVFCKTSLGHEQEYMYLYRPKPNHLRECVFFFLFFFVFFCFFCLFFCCFFFN